MPRSAAFKTIEKSCEQCGKRLHLRNMRDVTRRRFCSRTCKGTHTGNRKGAFMTGRKMSPETLGQRAATRRENCLGHRRLEKRGKNLYYWSVMTETGYRYEHRVVAEREMGFPLLDGETVHHVNGDGLDNRVENLLVMTRSEHSQHHARERSLAR